MLSGLLTITVGLNGLTAGAQEGEPPPGVLIEAGAEVFGTSCATCHGAGGRGTDDGPSLIGVGAASVDFQLRTGRMPLERPDAPTVHQPQQVSDEVRMALVAYVTSLDPPGSQGPPIPDVDGWREADLARGLELFVANCAACHGPTGAGIAVGQNDVSSNLDIASPIEIAEAVRAGPGVMPRFSDEIVTDADLEAVVRWVRSLDERDSPGGVSLGRSGPVTEGLIAWVLGLGLLTIAMYLLGDQASDEGPRRNEPAEDGVPGGSQPRTASGGDDDRA